MVSHSPLSIFWVSRYSVYILNRNPSSWTRRQYACLELELSFTTNHAPTLHCMMVSSNINSSNLRPCFPAFTYIFHSQFFHLLQDGFQCEFQWPTAAIPVSAAAEPAKKSTDCRFSARSIHTADLYWPAHVPTEHCPAYEPASDAAIRNTTSTSTA